MMWDFEDIHTEQAAVRFVLKNLGFHEINDGKGFSYEIKQLALLIPGKQTETFNSVLHYLDHIQRMQAEAIKHEGIYVPFASLYIRISFGRRIWQNCFRGRYGDGYPDPESA